MNNNDAALEKMAIDTYHAICAPFANEVDCILTALHRVRDAAAEDNDRLCEAIKWALGESGDFGPRPKGAGVYWWRKELRRRAAMNVGKGDGK